MKNKSDDGVTIFFYLFGRFDKGLAMVEGISSRDRVVNRK